MTFAKETGLEQPELRKLLGKSRHKCYDSIKHGSKTWNVKASDARRITAAEVKYTRRTAGYTWDRLQNKWTNCKGAKNNTNFGQITGIKEKLDRTCE